MRQKGFTVLELTITLTMFGVLSALFVPTFNTQVRDARRRAATQQFVSVQSLAKATALAHRRVAQLHIDAQDGRWWIEIDTSVVGGITDTIGPVTKIPPGVTMTSNRSLVCFDARGMSTQVGACEAMPITVGFAANDQSVQLTTTRLGKVLR